MIFLLFSRLYVFSLSWQDDEVVLQCVATIQKEHRKFCLAAEGLGNRLCYLEPTSEAKVWKPETPHQESLRQNPADKPTSRFY